MIRFILKRLLLLIPVILAVSFIVFTLMELTPGTIVDQLISEAMTPEDVQALREFYNLDRSMFYRYGLYMSNLLQGDMGLADYTRLPVWDLFIERLPNTLILAFSSLVVGMAVAIPMGIIAARRAGKVVDNLTTGFTLIGMSMPVFWIGVLLILIFSQQLGWLPASGFRAGWKSLVLPVICSGLTLTAIATRQTRSSMLEVLKSDYLRTARAKGVPESVVIRKHALGNAWIPTITALGTSLATQLAGAVVVESVFAWPGIGRLAAEAVGARDVTTTTGVVLMTTILYVLVHLVVDVLYAFVDPRIKAQYVSSAKRKKKAPASRNTRIKPLIAGSTAASQNIHEKLPESAPQESPIAVGQVQVMDTEAVAASTSEKEPDRSSAVSYVTRDLSFFSSVAVSAADDESQEPITDSRDESVLATKLYKKRSRIGEIFHHMSSNKGAMAGLCILAAMVVAFIASLFISWDAVTTTNVPYRFYPPSRWYLFGTDGLGRDMFMRVIYGTRYSLAIALGAVVFASFFGILLGSLAAFYGKVADETIMRFSDTLASIPGILLGMVIVTVLGQSLPNLIVAVGVSTIPIFIRISRAGVLTVRNNEFVEAAKAVGLSNIRIVFTQVVPNSLAPIIVSFSVSLGMSVIVASSLSFLGFGVPVPHPEWGAIISGNRDFAVRAPWLMTFPGLFIMITVLAFNLLGDGLRDALDPKLKKR